MILSCLSYLCWRGGSGAVPRAPEQSKDALRHRLTINGATPAEMDFLLRGQGQNGQRVELNSMASDQFVRFVVDKLREARRGQGRLSRCT